VDLNPVLSLFFLSQDFLSLGDVDFQGPFPIPFSPPILGRDWGAAPLKDSTAASLFSPLSVWVLLLSMGA